MSLKDKIMNFITAHPKIAPKIAVFSIGLAITFAIGIAIETIGIFHVQTAHAVDSSCGSWYNPECKEWFE